MAPSFASCRSQAGCATIPLIRRSTPRLPPVDPAGSVGSGPSLLHYFLRMIVALVLGAGCIFAIAWIDCSAIIGVWLACIFMIHQHYRLKKQATEFELRARAEWLQAGRNPAALPAAIELLILLLLALIFASGNYLYSNRCIETGGSPPAYTAQTESCPLTVSGLNGPG